MTAAASRLVLGVALASAIAGCAVTRVVEPADVPAGPPEAMGGEPIGPVVVIGSGQSQGTAWRYSVYQSADGICTQLETGLSTGAGCGALLPDGDAIFGGVSSSGDPNGATAVDGVVADDVADVALVLSNGAREPATLMSLQAAGLDGKAFVGFAPRGTTIEAVEALDDDGEVRETVVP